MTIKENYIRVTELLRPWQNFGNIPQSILDAKAEIGTNVHEAISCHSIGLPIPILTDREQKYFESYLKWEELNEPTFLCTEQRYYLDDLMLTGQIDAIVSFPGREEGRIIDFKCSANASEMHWQIQLGWYYILATKSGIGVNRNTFVIQLKDTGAPAKSYPFEITNEVIRICHAVYSSYTHFNPIKKHPELGICC